MAQREAESSGGVGGDLHDVVRLEQDLHRAAAPAVVVGCSEDALAEAAASVVVPWAALSFWPLGRQLVR